MKSALRPLLLAVLAVAPSPARAAPGAEVYIGVEGAAGRENVWAVGLPPFQPEAQGRGQDARLGAEIREVVRADLLFSRRFKPVPSPSAEAAADPRARQAEWKQAGAGFVLSARVSALPDKAAAAVTLLDLASGQPLLERYYRQGLPYWRSLAHQIADDVTRQLTGKPGVAHTQIAFVNDATGRKEVYTVDYDGERLKQLTRDRSIDLLPRWSPDRRKLVYTSYRYGNPDLIELDLERGAARVLLSQQGLNVAGGFSSDGSRLVLTQSRQRSPNLYLMDLPGGALRPLTSHFGADSSPTFSPDGRQVAFVSDRSGNPQVHVLQLSGGKTRLLTRLNWCDSPAWSPTGEWIAFAGRAHYKDPLDIFLVDPAGIQVRQLTHGEGSNENPSWSPDGRFLAFTSNRDGRRRLFAMDSDGSAPHPVAEIPGNSFTPNWSP